MTEIFWVDRQGPGRLGLMPRPRGGDWLSDEIASMRDQGVDILISTLTDWETDELELDRQAQSCDRGGVEYWRFPISDRSVPSVDKGLGFLHRVRAKLKQGKSVVIHCRLGIGRSGMLSAGVLVLEGKDAVDALTDVSAARRRQVPDTQEQIEWLDRLQRDIIAE